MITILDYGVGNIGSIQNMLRREGIKSEIVNKAEQLKKATKIILPGNGAFDTCMNSLNHSNMLEKLNYLVKEKKVPCLGICVGAQMLGNSSEEGKIAGLGWIDMQVKRIPRLDNLPVPHMGWNYIHYNQNIESNFNDLEGSRYYFVHSYYMEPKNKNNILMYTNYGINFASAVIKENIIGVQFHPEKSHNFGRKLFKIFAEID